MSRTKSNTSYNVRPDRHKTAQINELNPEAGVIVYDTDNNVEMFYNGTAWISLEPITPVVGSTTSVLINAKVDEASGITNGICDLTDGVPL